MRKRELDFYRVVRVERGKREYLTLLNINDEYQWLPHRHDGAGWSARSDAQRAVDLHGGWVVPVRVSIVRAAKGGA